VPALPSWLVEPLWVQLEALLPKRPMYDPAHPLGCHRRRINDRIIFDKLLQVLRFGCSYEGIADTTCSATTIRNRRDEWIKTGAFAELKQLALDAYDRIVGLLLDDIAVDGCITKAPGGGELAGPSPVDRRKQGMKRSLLVDGYGIPLRGSWPRPIGTTHRCWAPPWIPSTGSGPLPDDIAVHLDAGYDSGKTRTLLDERKLTGEIAHKGEKVPVQATGRWYIERTNAWHNAFGRLARCSERRESVVDAFFDLADTITTVRSLIRRAWTTHRWGSCPNAADDPPSLNETIAYSF
jgi:transposase